MALPMTITCEQSLEVGVTGPEPANRMFIIAGARETNVAALPSSPHTKETVVALVGPVLTREQFVRAIATASIASSTWGLGSTHSAVMSAAVASVGADFDDESGRTELRVEIDLEANPEASPSSS
jgi:hypothetical protein